MKITTNMVGNYSQQITGRNVNSAKANEPAVKTGTKQQVKAQNNVVTADEKKFFMGLYPQNKSEIVDYHFYRRNGEMSGVKVGSLFDKRG